jgi:hypothetical protein
MWNAFQFSVEDEAKEFEFINDRYGNAIYSELWVCMQSELLKKMHADGFGFRELKSIFVSPILNIVETKLQ